MTPLVLSSHDYRALQFSIFPGLNTRYTNLVPYHERQLDVASSTALCADPDNMVIEIGRILPVGGAAKPPPVSRPDAETYILQTWAWRPGMLCTHKMLDDGVNDTLQGMG